MTLPTFADGRTVKLAPLPVRQDIAISVLPTHQGPPRLEFGAPQNHIVIEPSGCTVQ